MNTNSIKKQEVFIYVEDFDRSSINKKWKDQKYNPGFGGTIFQQLRLISELQENYKNFLLYMAYLFSKYWTCCMRWVLESKGCD